MIIAGLATAVCIVATVALLRAERAIAEGRAGEPARRGAKLVAAAAFVTVALAGSDWPYGRWILAALVLGALGDAALLGRKRRAFVLGLLLFGADHACVLRAAALVVRPDDWPLAWFAIPALAAAGLVAWLWRHLGSVRIPVALYALLISATVAAAAMPLLVGAPDWFGGRRAALLAGGALSFFVSDLAVARQRFVHESFWNKAWGQPLYFAGQLLIAWSAAV